MAGPKDTVKPSATIGAQAPAPQPTQGELEEAAAESGLDLQAENAILRTQLEQLMRRLEALERQPSTVGEALPAARVASDTDPVFDPEEPHGVVVGDTEVAYVQNGHQFGRDRQYLRTEVNRGSPRAFNPRLVGVVKRPKPAEAA